MKRRVLGFLLGAVLGLAAAYLLRRLRNQQNEAVSLPPTTSPTINTPQAEKPAEVETPRPTGKYTVRTNGPRPQGTIESADSGNDSAENFTVTRSTEPKSATETDATAASSRSDIQASPEMPKAEVEPATTVVSEEAAPSPAESEALVENEEDDLTVITGIGQVFSSKLKEQGISTYAALATLSAEEIAEKTGIAQERIERDNWQEQAKNLVKEAKKKTKKTEDKSDKE